jgi:hypothetical protein
VRRQLQNRVVLSTRTGRLDFYYRIPNTQGREPATAAFGGPPLRVTYRLDGLGTVLAAAAPRARHQSSAASSNACPANHVPGEPPQVLRQEWT